MKKETAVEWLEELIENQREEGKSDLRTILHFCTKAKSMEKQQIINAFFAGYNYDGGKTEEKAEQYYNKTFKSE